jgi:hypothetical protein
MAEDENDREAKYNELKGAPGDSGSSFGIVDTSVPEVCEVDYTDDLAGATTRMTGL